MADHYVMVRAREWVTTRLKEPEGEGWELCNSVPRRSRGHYCIILIPDREGSEPRRDEAELSNRLRTDDQDEMVLLSGCFIAFPLVANSTLELWRAKPTGKLRVGRTCQKTRRNHSRHCKFSLSTILHASPAVGVEASQQLEPPALTSPCIRRLDDAEVRRRS